MHMKNILLITWIVLIGLSCSKNSPAPIPQRGGGNNDNPKPNRPPIANAGINQEIFLPANTTVLIGSGSFDPDFNITRYIWTKISGPDSAIIVSSTAIQTTLNHLKEGIYIFELSVTDAEGLTGKDTVEIKVSKPGNVNFYLKDPTGSVPWSTLSFSPAINLVNVHITNYTDGKIQGLWGGSRTPGCPITSDYFAEPDLYTSFNLPPGTYTWTATTFVTSLPAALVPGPLYQFFTAPHQTQGTITVLPTDDCINIGIVF